MIDGLFEFVVSALAALSGMPLAFFFPCNPCCGCGVADGKPRTDPANEGTWVPSGTWQGAGGVTWTFIDNPGDDSGETWFFFGSSSDSKVGGGATVAERKDWGNICNWYSSKTTAPSKTDGFSAELNKRATRLPPVDAVVHIYTDVSTETAGPQTVQYAYFWLQDFISGSEITCTAAAHDSVGGAVFMSVSENFGTVNGGALFNVGANNSGTGTVNDGAVFNDNSFNQGTVNDGAVFNVNSKNLNGTVNGGAVFNKFSDNFSIVNDGAVFNDSTDNRSTGTVNDGAVFNDLSRNTNTVNGGAVFNDDSRSIGTVNDGAVFNDDSINQDTVNNGAVFNDNSRSVGTGIVNDGATFNDASDNFGTVNDGATFNDASDNFGTVNNGATFNTGSRNFSTVNDGAVFNDNSINFSTVNGGATFNDAACTTAQVGNFFALPCTRKFVAHPTDLPTCNGTAPNGCASSADTCGCG